VRYETVTGGTVNIAVIRDVKKCSLVETYRYYRMISCFHLRRTLKIKESDSYDMLANFYR